LEICVTAFIFLFIVLFVDVASASAGDTASINGRKQNQIGCQEEYAQHQGDAQCRFVGQKEAQHRATTTTVRRRCACQRVVVVVVAARFRRHDVGIHKSPVAADPCQTHKFLLLNKKKKQGKCVFLFLGGLWRIAMATRENLGVILDVINK
jgi:hypothetical protein